MTSTSHSKTINSTGEKVDIALLIKDLERCNTALDGKKKASIRSECPVDDSTDEQSILQDMLSVSQEIVKRLEEEIVSTQSQLPNGAEKPKGKILDAVQKVLVAIGVRKAPDSKIASLNEDCGQAVKPKKIPVASDQGALLASQRAYDRVETGAEIEDVEQAAIRVETGHVPIIEDSEEDTIPSATGRGWSRQDDLFPRRNLYSRGASSFITAINDEAFVFNEPPLNTMPPAHQSQYLTEEEQPLMGGYQQEPEGN